MKTILLSGLRASVVMEPGKKLDKDKVTAAFDCGRAGSSVLVLRLTWHRRAPGIQKNST